MDPMTLMTLIFIGLPILGIIFVFIPIYIGMLTSLYIIYKPQDHLENPVLSMKFKFRKVIDSYEKLYDYWVLYGDALSMSDFVLPLFIPPVLGLLVSCFVGYYFAQYCRGIFRL